MRRVAVIVVVGALLALTYLALAWLVVMNTDACWWPWHDVLPGKEHLCSIGI